MVVLPTFRFWCADVAEDHLAVIIMLTTAPYFLFFCRLVTVTNFNMANVCIELIKLDLCSQWLQNCWSIRSDDLPNGDG